MMTRSVVGVFLNHHQAYQICRFLQGLFMIFSWRQYRQISRFDALISLLWVCTLPHPQVLSSSQKISRVLISITLRIEWTIDPTSTNNICQTFKFLATLHIGVGFNSPRATLFLYEIFNTPPPPPFDVMGNISIMQKTAKHNSLFKNIVFY